MSLLGASLSMGFFALVALTYWLWMKPPKNLEETGWYPVIAASVAVIFVIMCFTLGVWFSVQKMRGEFWKL